MARSSSFKNRGFCIMDNMGRNIRESLFTISGYMSCAVDVIKGKYKNLLVALLPLWLVGFAISYLQIYLSNQYESVYFNGVSFNVMRFPLLVFLLGIATIFLQIYLFGVIYTQTRAHIDHREFSIKDTFIYISKRLGSFITNILAMLLLVLGGMVGLLIYFLVVSMFTFASSQLTPYGALSSTFMLLLSIGYIVFMGVFVFFMLKFYFSRYVVLNYQYGGFKALGYSNFITKGFKGRLFGYVLLFIAVSFSLQIILYMIFSAVLFGSVIFTMNVFYSIFGGAIFSLITTIITSLLSGFMMLFMSGVFINIDSIKKNSPYLNNELLIRAQDKFEEYCIMNNVPSSQQEVHEPNIIE